MLEDIKKNAPNATFNIMINNYGNMTLAPNINIQNLGIQVEDNSTFLKLLAPVSNDEEVDVEQKLVRLNANNVDFNLLKISTITRSTCLIRYSGSNGGPWHGSGFFSTVDTFSRPILFSAGDI